MTVIELNKDWKALKNRTDRFDFFIPEGADSVDLPYDFLTETGRTYAAGVGEYNGFYDTALLILYKKLPATDKQSKVILDVSGLSGTGEIFINGQPVRTVTSPARCLTDITKYLCGDDTLKIRLCSYADSGKYTGLGIGGSVKLLVLPEKLYIEPMGVFVQTESLGEKAKLTISVTVRNETKDLKNFGIFAEILNAKHKRVSKKIRKVKLKGGSTKTFSMPVNMTRRYEWNTFDPYLYTCKVSLVDNGEKTVDEAEQKFGIIKSGISAKTLKINGKSLKLKGAVVMRGDPLLGNASEYSAEYEKLKKLKNLGFNAVRYIGCPTDATLDALDNLGLFLVADIFDNLGSGKFVNDGHLFFDDTYKEVTEYSVKTLRNHPCCIMYSLCNDADETYGRRGGVETLKSIKDTVREFDGKKLITVNAIERAPTKSEAEKYDIKLPKNIAAEDNAEKKLISLAREKDLFRKCTDEVFALADVAGYSYLYPRYCTDKAIPGRIILGLASHTDKAFDALEETDKTLGVIGDFTFCAFDFIGKQDDKKIKENALTLPHINTNGLFDACGRKKIDAYYREILLGKKNTSYIVVEDPETAGSNGEVGTLTHMWNWPKNIGKPIRVFVYTSGDIVALYLDGKSVGRKLAGKFNKHVAEFKTNFYPGKLEAISYHKGLEQSRTSVETVSSPKMIKAECKTKTINEGELCYIDIAVADREGRVVPYAARDIEVIVSGEGELVALGNGDPESLVNKKSTICPVYGGYCTAVVRGTGEGKISVKAVSEGLSQGKVTIKVR